MWATVFMETSKLFGRVLDRPLSEEPVLIFVFRVFGGIFLKSRVRFGQCYAGWVGWAREIWSLDPRPSRGQCTVCQQSWSQDQLLRRTHRFFASTNCTDLHRDASPKTSVWRQLFEIAYHQTSRNRNRGFVFGRQQESLAALWRQTGPVIRELVVRWRH